MKLSVYKNNQLINQIDLMEILKLHADSESFEFSVGRSHDTHVVLDDPQVSRLHAAIVYSDHSWEIIKKSSYGTFTVNGSSVEKSLLATGDIVNIGPYQIHIEISELTIEKVSPVVEIEEVAPVEDVVVEHIAPVEAVEAPPEVEENYDNVIVDEEFEDEPVIEEEEIFNSTDDSLNFEEASSSTKTMGMDLVDDSDKTSFISTFANFELSIFGEYAPYDRYLLTDDEVFIGRDPNKCQIVLQDNEVSSSHAVLKRTIGGYRLEDLNSANGTLLRGERINKVDLNAGDEFVIGSTTFGVSVVSELLSAEKDRLMPVEKNQEIEVEEIVEEEFDFADSEIGKVLSADEGGAGKKSLVSKFMAMPPKKRLIYGLVGIILIYFLIGEDAPKKKTPQKGEPDYSLVKKQKASTPVAAAGKKVKLSPENLEFVEAAYQIAKAKLYAGKYNEAILELNKIIALDPEFKQTAQLLATAKEGLAKLEEQTKKLKQEEERKIRLVKVGKLLEKAREATEKHQVSLAETLFSQIYELDPENIDVPQLKLELEAWQKEQERIALEKAQKEAERKRMVDALAPGRNHYLRKEWYKAILRLEEFLEIKKMDEDLIKSGQNMLTDSKNNLGLLTAPLLGKARSLKEGQDLKSAYETYKEVLVNDPANGEAMDEMSEIRDMLFNRSRKIYREGLVAEELSLFNEAKEKYQEVQQISPTDSEYYQKATHKLDSFWH